MPVATEQPAPQAQEPILSPQERRAWSAPRRGPMLAHFLAVWVQIATGLALAIAFPNPITMIVGFLLVAGGQHGLALVTHEFVHYLAFPRRRRLNDLVGAWLFSGPAGLPFALYRQRHFDHHRLVSTEDDTKSLYKRNYRGFWLAVECLRSLCGIDYVGQVVTTLRGESGRRRRGGTAPRVSLLGAMVPLVGSQAAIAAILCLIDPRVYLGLWALPLVTMAQLFSKLRSAVEHHPLEAESGGAPQGPYYKGTEAPFVRSVRASWLERLFLCKVNFCYHHEHHRWPQISYQYLPRLRRRARDRESGGAVREESYLRTLVRFWRGL